MRCGVGDYTASLARALAQQPGLTVGVLAGAGAGPQLSSSGAVEPDFVGTMPSWRRRDWPRLVRTMRSWRPDIVHSQHPTQGYQAHWLPALLPSTARLIGAKAARTWHEPAGLSFGSDRAWRLWLRLQTAAGGPIFTVRPNFYDLVAPCYRKRLSQHQLITLPTASSLPVMALSDAERATERRSSGVPDGTRMVSYFGFLAPNKGAELLLDIARPERDHLVFIGGEHLDPAYVKDLRLKADAPRWQGKVHFRGFLLPEEAARALAASDAVVLPFRDGGGSWNSSLIAASAQGTPVVTTAEVTRGLNGETLVHCSAPGDVESLRGGLDQLIGRRRRVEPRSVPDQWADIAALHALHYRKTLGGRQI